MPDGTNRRDLPMQTRQAAIEPASFDDKARTVELVWSTGATVRRMDWWSGQRYDESLSLDEGAVDLSRLNGGAPLLDTHGQWSLSGVIGVVERAWITDGEGRALVRFSDREDVAPVVADVRAGIIRNVSVGYIVRKYEITKREGGVDQWRAVDWQPTEISLVPVGADAGAGTRRADPAMHPCEIVNRAQPAHNREAIMPKTTDPAGNAAPQTEEQRAAQTPAVQQPDPEQIRREAAEAERKRGQDIRARVRKVGLPDEVGDDLIARGVALDHVGEVLVDEIAKRGGASGIVRPPRVEGGFDGSDPAVKREIMEEALLARASQSLNDPQARVAITERARDYAYSSFLQMCAEIARAHGERIPQNLPPAALWERLVALRSLSTSDFPLLLANVGNKILVKAYELAQPTFKLFFARKTFNDFKPHSFIRAGDFPNLLAKGETGEFKYGAMSESQQQITLAEYGRIVRISRRIIINDDLGAFADLPAKAGRRVADFENATAYAQFALNSGDGPTITETTRALFNTTDVTKASSGTAIGVTPVAAGRAAMMKKTSLDGLKLNIMPRYLVTSPDKFTAAEQFCAIPIFPTADGSANPFKGRLTPVGDANLSGTPWYLFADPADIETFIYGYLNGLEGPRLATQEGFTTEGTDLRVAEDFVAGAIDFRGAYKDPGA